MAPKYKATSKSKHRTTDWLLCSLCDRLISDSDAELHSASCESEHGFIQSRVIHGKSTVPERVLDEAGAPVSQTVKDIANTVWLSIQAMQVCGLSIGRPCVVNRMLVLRAWPAKMSSLTAVAMTHANLELLGIDNGGVVTVERLHNIEAVANSVTLLIRESNSLFRTEQFSSFVAASLDGKFVTVGTPLAIHYFGQICKCQVNTVVNKLKKSQLKETLTGENESTSEAGEIQQSTPVKWKNNNYTLPMMDSPSISTISPVCNVNPLIKGTPTDDISESLSSLNISNMSPDSESTSNICERYKYPHLLTLVKGSMNETRDLNQHHGAFSKVCVETQISVLAPCDAESMKQKEVGSTVSLKDLGGLSSQIAELRSRIKRALQPSSSSRCTLIYGPAGTGKTMLAKALTSDLGLHTIYVAGTDIWSKLFGEAESNLKKVFKLAQDRSPSILLIDDLDIICPKRSQSQAGQQVHRIVGTILSLIDNCTATKASPVAILGLTNNKDDIDPALRRSGRFGCEVELGVPTALNRIEILRVMLSTVENSLSEADITTIGKNAHGYVGADLAALISEACMHAASMSDSDRVPSETTVAMRDCVYAGLHIKPSALREIQLEIPEVRWSDIGGMSEVKMRLREAVELPLSDPDIFRQLGIEPPRGLLMYGPPGCSKTMVARALATECHLNFLAVKGPELFNQYVGESERAVREVFRKARSAAPSIIFFDEIDAIAAKRGGSSGSGVDDRVLTQLLTEMDGMETLKDVFVMAATNRPDKMDRALLRPGRFDSLVYVPLPDGSTRQEILEKKFEKMKVDSGVSVPALVESTENYSGAELIQVCQEAALCALRENLSAHFVSKKHFDFALEKVQPQIDLELLGIYEQFSKIKS